MLRLLTFSSLLLCSVAIGEDKPPANVLDQLAPWTEQLKKNTTPEVKEIAKDQFILTKFVATDVKIQSHATNIVNMPYSARIIWISNRQDTKISQKKEQAEKSTSWLTLNKKAGAPNVSYGLSTFAATLNYSKDKKWELEEVGWISMLVKEDYNFQIRSNGWISTKDGKKHPWHDLLKEVKLPK